MLNTLKEHINSNNLFSNTESLLIAVSGGVDSMVLTAMMDELGFTYSVAHVDHNTRSGTSTNDMKFVNNYFKTKGIAVYNYSYKHKGEGNFHDMAHKSRYRFFQSLSFDKVLTAHHKDDHLETIMINIFNGRSMDGILQVRENIVRPLLLFTKADLLSYARTNKVPYKEDTSNSENTYLRNSIRNSILPLLSDKNDITQKIVNLSARKSEDENLLRELVAGNVTIKSESGLQKISLNQLRQKNPVFVFHALASYGINRSQAIEISRALCKVGKEWSTKSHTIVIDREDLMIQHLKVNYEKEVVQLKDLPFVKHYGSYTLKFDLVDRLPSEIKEDEAYFPMELLADHLVLRPWRDGDYFYPYGMNGQKKTVKKLFADMKIDRLTKASLPIILSMSKIIWLPTLRSDHNYRVRPHDTDILKIEISS